MRIFYKIIFFLYVLCLAYLCFSSSSMLPDSPSFLNFNGADKLVHYLMFLPFPWIFYLVISRRIRRPRVQDLVTVLCFGIVLSGSTELIQLLLPGRECSFADFSADMLSVTANSLLLLLLPPRWKW